MVTVDISIRPFRAGDERAFRELNEEWISKYFGIEEQDRLVLGDPELHIIEPGGHIFMAFDGGQPIGCCALIRREDPYTFELGKMSVTPAYRGQGVGRRILEYAIAQARALGAKALYLESNARLANAVHLYESCGFVHLPPNSNCRSLYTRADVFMELRLT
jgi:putative acetyltransferase